MFWSRQTYRQMPSSPRPSSSTTHLPGLSISSSAALTRPFVVGSSSLEYAVSSDARVDASRRSRIFSSSSSRISHSGSLASCSASCAGVRQLGIDISRNAAPSKTSLATLRSLAIFSNAARASFDLSARRANTSSATHWGTGYSVLLSWQDSTTLAAYGTSSSPVASRRRSSVAWLFAPRMQSCFTSPRLRASLSSLDTGSASSVTTTAKAFCSGPGGKHPWGFTSGLSVSTMWSSRARRESGP